jgi:predicted nucleic acid-binding protein
VIVLDASVAVKLLVSEPGSSIAQDLFDSASRIAAPAIARIEVAGAVLRRHRQGEIKEEHARAACDRWARLLEHRYVQLIPDDQLYAQALGLAFGVRHLLTDCLYIAAAISLGCPLVTADVAMHQRGRGAYERIELLSKPS